jgi:hypothetical protein
MIMKELKVSISFAEEDNDFAEKIIIGLLQKGTRVISNSISTSDQIKNWGKDLFTIVEDHFSQEIDYCIVLVTQNYQRSKWNEYSKCFLLQSAYERRNFILPVKIGKNIPSLPGLNLINYLEVKEGDFQSIIDSFISKALIANEGVNFLRGYNDIESILKLFDSKADWIKLTKEKDLQNDKGIGFDLFANKNRLFDRIISYVLYLYEGITIKNTADYVLSDHNYIFKDNNLLILIPYERKQKDFDKRKANISAALNTRNVFYINEFIWKYCTPKEFQESKFEIPLQNFVTPYIETDSRAKLKADIYLIQWLNQFDDPILVLNGTGGIGKTTLAKWIVNYVHKNKPNTRAIFIDSSEITTYLLRSLDVANELDLYKFYEADFEDRLAKNQTTGKKLENIEFKCNLDNGNIIIIIDGLDEVITRLGDLFDINNFFKSIFRFTSNIGNGKVIITTRNYFWEKFKINGNRLQSVEVCPFDLDLTKEFFKSYFNNNHKFVQKAIDIATAWMPDKSKNQYIPFVLDLVTYIIESVYDNSIIQDSLFDSEILSIQIYNDYLLYKVCERELFKLDKILTVDSQIHLFIRIASTYNCKISETQLKTELSDLTNKGYTSKTLEAFKSHPILKWVSENSELIFKYDLFDEHFKNLYLGLLLNSKVELNNKLIRILADFNNYNSSFQENLVKRLTNFNDDIKLQILSIIEGIKNHKLDELDVTREIKNRALSSIFIFVLKSFPNNITKNTELLKELFESNGNINSLCLINCNVINSPKILFDFSDLKLLNCTFQNYEYFGDCNFNDKTIFENCKFEKLSLNPKLTYSFKPHNFKHPDGDENFKDTLRSKSLEKGNTKKEIVEDVKNFLASFYTRGDVYTLTPELLRKKFRPKVIPLKDMIRFFEEEGICYSYISPKKENKYAIHKDCRDIIIQFVINGKNSMKIENVLKKLLKEFK